MKKQLSQLQKARNNFKKDSYAYDTFTKLIQDLMLKISNNNGCTK